MDSEEPKKKRMRPARTPEAREQQLISLAVDLVEKRLIEGTASAQETVHFLKLASQKAQLEKKELEERIKLLEAKTEAIQSSRVEESFYKEVIEAVKGYQGVQNDTNVQ